MRVHLANRIAGLMVLALAGLAACDQQPTEPTGIAKAEPVPAAIVITSCLASHGRNARAASRRCCGLTASTTQSVSAAPASSAA